MEQEENLAKLEESIDKLLNAMQELREEKNQLKAMLEKKEQEAFEAKRQLDSMQGERNRMHQRVSGLIDAIDRWEKSAEKQSSGKQSGAQPGESKTLF